MHLRIIKEHFHALVITAFKLVSRRGSIILLKSSTIKTYAVGSKQSYFNLLGALAKDASIAACLVCGFYADALCLRLARPSILPFVRPSVCPILLARKPESYSWISIEHGMLVGHVPHYRWNTIASIYIDQTRQRIMDFCTTCYIVDCRLVVFLSL